MNKAFATATVLAVMVAPGCTGPMDKSGAEPKPTVLVLASSEGSDTDSAPAVARFVQLVDELSDGRLEVLPSPDWRSQGERRVLEDVTAGKADLGWSGTRVFDTIGVDAFRTLHAPFLIGSYEAERAVVGDAVAQDMLSGLGSTGLTGLAVLADELRFPAGAEGPLRRASDFAGLDFGVVPSRVQLEAVRALGADAETMTRFDATGTEGLEALETMWRTYVTNGQSRTMPFVTANAVLWPRTTVLVANTKVFETLSERDRDVVVRAARGAAEWSLEHAADQVPDEVAAACQGGARVVTMSPRQLAALRRAAEPVYADMHADADQADLLSRVERLVRGAAPDVPIEVPEGCAYRPGDENHLAVRVLPDPLFGPGRSGRLPAGTYRYVLTEKEIDAGLHLDEDFARANAGVWSWTLGGGRWSYEIKLDAQELPEGFAAPTCEGYYDVHGDQVDFTTVTEPTSGDCASKTWKASWRRLPDGLAMDVTTDADDLDFLFGAKTWERIG